jgi:hypothetical protein
MFSPMLLPAGVEGAAVAGLHDAGAAAGDDVDRRAERRETRAVTSSAKRRASS